MNSDFLYPNINDPSFNIKIAERKEFNDTKYKIHESDDIINLSDKLCFTDFELAPHQIFVKHFLSSYTPYNSLLLYHGLGTGKTCSAISVAEEMRDYLKELDYSNKIIIVASPNVQDNFKLQLFDEKKLQCNNGYWNINSCVGNKLLNEINPLNIKGITKKQIVLNINKIIKKNYLFFGYTEFGNYIQKRSNISDLIESKEVKKKIIKNNLIKKFNNTLIIIDEVHNIRITDDNNNKKIALELMKLVENVDNIKLLLLSATPMYNSYKEIIWLTNLLNINDNNSAIKINDVFDKNGNFLIDDKGNNVGKDLLKLKLTGYVSYLSGENPYMFPFRIWPSDFSPENTFTTIEYPRYQLDNKIIIQPIQYLSLYLTNIGSYQKFGYNIIINDINKNITKINSGFNYTILQKPLQALNIIYPNTELNDYINKIDIVSNTEGDDIDIETKNLIGLNGISNIMKFDNTAKPIFKGNYEYKNDKYGRLFSYDEIGKYSSKIKNICNKILNSKGVVLIYSQFLNSGLIPIALALEELGFSRTQVRPSLFKTPPSNTIDAITYKTKKANKEFNPAKYAMITGDVSISPNNVRELQIATDLNNKDGKNLKVILISQAGSEGLDFKFIRQVHILEPWYNISRSEQIIGRAIRNCSHKDLPFNERNVELYLYSTLLEDDKESVDTYIYRYSELKAIKIGNISRLIKQISVDCLLNYDMQVFNQDSMNKITDIQLSSGKTIQHKIGFKPYTYNCDFKDNCSYYCNPMKIINNDDVNYNTYNDYYIKSNRNAIINKIKMLYKKKFFYNKQELILHINHFKEYPIDKIYDALDTLINSYEYITDMYDRLGKLINIGDLYFFQPIELNNHKISLFDRKKPIDFKNKHLSFIFDNENENIQHDDDNIIGKNILNIMNENYNKVFKIYDTIRGVKDWYIICSFAFNILKNKYDENLLDELLIAHIMEKINITDTIQLLNYIRNIDSVFVNKIKAYIDKNTISNDSIDNPIIGYLTQDDNKLKILVNNDNVWSIAKEEDVYDLSVKIGKINETFLPIKSKLNNIVGFMNEFKKKNIIFKVKYMKLSRNKGARCDQNNRNNTLIILNEILKSNEYDNNMINKKTLCIILEFILRILNKKKLNNKIWFLNPYESAILNIENKTF